MHRSRPSNEAISRRGRDRLGCRLGSRSPVASVSRCLMLALPLWLLLVVLRSSPDGTAAGGGVRLQGANVVSPRDLREGLKAGAASGSGGDAAWRSALRSAFSPDILAGNVTEILWREFLTVKMTHVLSEVRKAGHTQHCKYDPDLSMIPPSSSRIFIASNLHNSEDVMPNFIVQLVQFLLAFPERLFFVSIYESGSTDSTAEWLELLEDVLNELRVHNRIVMNGAEVRQQGQERLDFLSRVRNRALEPLWSPPVGRWDKIVFINDVFFCAQDIIRLLQHDADIVCGMDFIKGDLAAVPKHILQRLMVSDLTKRFYFSEEYAKSIIGKAWVLKQWRKSLARRDAVSAELPWIFYDIWVAHDLGGSQFVNHPPYIVNDTYAASRVKQGLPFPAQCCWNGMVVLNAEPFQRGLRFRTHEPEECATSECILMCQDFQRLGYKRVLVDPGVRQAYDYTGALNVYTDLVQDIPVLSWAEVLKSEPVQMRAIEADDRVECCPLMEGEELVDWRDCYWYDIWKPNYTDSAIQNPDAWLLPYIPKNQTAPQKQEVQQSGNALS
eukprot:evm.model.scf_943.3 EVM.evm.TU.scf_943.3   scf_943:37794-39458(+)